MWGSDITELEADKQVYTWATFVYLLSETRAQSFDYFQRP